MDKIYGVRQTPNRNCVANISLTSCPPLSFYRICTECEQQIIKRESRQKHLHIDDALGSRELWQVKRNSSFKDWCSASSNAVAFISYFKLIITLIYVSRVVQLPMILQVSQYFLNYGLHSRVHIIVIINAFWALLPRVCTWRLKKLLPIRKCILSGSLHQ